jgi:glycosyltransferase involved in cell wall biosynthesis
MKIGFFGNTANIPLVIAQAMQNMGHEVKLIVNREDLLYRPESRFPEYYQGYPEWIFDGSKFSEWDYISLDPKIAPVLEVLSSCDALFLNDLGPSLLPILSHPAISFLTGSDLTHYADFHTIEVRSEHWSDNYKKTFEAKQLKRTFVDFIQRQRDGIRMSVAVRYFPPGAEPHGESLLEEIGVPVSRRFFQTTTEVSGIIPTPQPNNEPVRVYCPVRLTWKLPFEPGRSALDYKGSDIMVRGLGLFYRKNGIKLDIVLMRKGLHIAELEQLIADENIADQVTWLDEMSLTAYRKEIALSDIILEQFGDTSLMGSVGFDAMASARPVIANARPEILGYSMPVCQARTPEEICMQLERLVFDPQEREQVGMAGREYVEKNVSIDLYARKCLTYFESSLSGKNTKMVLPQTDFSSYLQQRLSLLHLPPGFDASRSIPLKKSFTKEVGFAWRASLNEFAHIADGTDNACRSNLVLLEDGKPFWRRHSLHDDIRNIGLGRYSHWQDGLIFSTSDNSDPNVNGRIYQIVLAESVD